MYLSLMKLNREQCKALKITDTYSLHRIVYDCFEKTREDMQESSGILFTEIAGNALEKRMLILSQKEPIASYDCQLKTKKIAEKFFDYPQYRFEVVINPIKRESASRKIVPMRTREEVAQWFSSRSSSWGFTIAKENLEVTDIFVDTFTKNNQKVTLGKAKIQGILQIENKEAFLQAFSNGLGKGKAFGCGLLQLKPL